MSISMRDVAKIAGLARLELSDHEKETLRTQLSAIVDYIGTLNELDTEAVEPTAHVLDVKNVFRTDEKKDSLPIEKTLSNAPERSGNFFKVPKIIE